ncbi:hypothetical protein MSAN_02127000 [Mycena sanguinolenta]|uniref:Uncharacterized protein n=1 Tax=Mycena sanguinolenta TaxID=230812 RepID=A0A8H7CK63_9AGAR|nr:hypothetical protein MSAN_02127000 [Mycena sanguinolenta]
MSRHGPVFVYYKMFDDDKKEMLSIRSPATRDGYIGRVDVSRIPAPHTVGALVQRICRQENRRCGIDWENADAYGTSLLRTVDSSDEYNLQDAVDLLGDSRPGSTPQAPVLLKIWYEELQAVLIYPEWDAPKERNVNSHKSPVFIYYKVYDEKKEMLPLRSPVETGTPYLGRVDACQIPTPHMIGSLAKEISNQENRPIGIDWDHDSAYGTMLLKTFDSPMAYDLEDAVDLLAADRPGSTPQEPVLLKVWYEEVQALMGNEGWERPAVRLVDSHRNVRSRP